MRILGIDPGSRLTGWGVVESVRGASTYVASGTLRLGEGAALPERLLTLSEGLESVCSEYLPECCALEEIFSARNARSALVLGHARGVSMLTVTRHGIPLFEYAPTQVKHSIVGAGRATKDQVNQMVGILLNRREKYQEDEADALAVALTHAVFTDFRRKTQ